MPDVSYHALPMKHSPLGASAAHRWMVCPGSVAQSEGMPNIGSTAAREGTAAHNIAANCLEDNTDAWEHAGRTIIVEGETFIVDDEMVEGVQLYLDTVRADYFDGTQLHVELRVKIPVDDALYGTSDAVIVVADQRLIRVYDFKYGKGIPVEVEDNPQLLYYAAGVVFDLLKGSSFNINEIEIVIVQPRFDHPDGPVRRYTLTLRQLGVWLNETLLPAVKAVREPNAPLHTGDHCRWCPAERKCPERRKEFMELANVSKISEAADTPPEDLEDWELADVMNTASRVEHFITACRDEAFLRLARGKLTGLGFKLVRGKVNRKWKDGAEMAIRAAYGDAAYKRTLFSPKGVEGLEGGKAIAAEWAFKPDAGLTMAAESDKRKAVTAKTAREVFGII